MFDPTEAGIVISTYQMISFPGQRNEKTEEKLQKIKQIQWGLMILDEV
jgi:superfamily II DNA or RNA helicase